MWIRCGRLRSHVLIGIDAKTFTQQAHTYKNGDCVECSAPFGVGIRHKSVAAVETAGRWGDASPGSSQKRKGIHGPVNHDTDDGSLRL